MPVKSSTSSVLKWPNAEVVIKFLKQWAEKIALNNPDVLKIGFFGSYARGNWGVGSDLDVILILKHCEKPFERRGLLFDTLSFPVPVDLLVYTQEEWRKLLEEKGFAENIKKEIIWIYSRQ